MINYYLFQYFSLHFFLSRYLHTACGLMSLLMFCLILCRLSTEGQEFFTSYDEVHDSFDAMGLQENLLRGIYAYGRCRWYLMLFAFLFDARLLPCIVVVIYISGLGLCCSCLFFFSF